MFSSYHCAPSGSAFKKRLTFLDWTLVFIPVLVFKHIVVLDIIGPYYWPIDTRRTIKGETQLRRDSNTGCARYGFSDFFQQNKHEQKYAAEHSRQRKWTKATKIHDISNSQDTNNSVSVFENKLFRLAIQTQKIKFHKF